MAKASRLRSFLGDITCLDLPDLVCKICAEVHQKNPTKRQKFYISRRSRYHFHMMAATPNQNFEIFFFSHKRDATCWTTAGIAEMVASRRASCKSVVGLR